MIKWINNKLDNMLLKRVVKNDAYLTDKDKDYLKKMGKSNPEFMNILEKIATAYVVTGMSARTVEGLIKRDSFIKCIGMIKTLMTSKEEKKQDRITNKRV